MSWADVAEADGQTRGSNEGMMVGALGAITAEAGDRVASFDDVDDGGARSTVEEQFGVDVVSLESKADVA